MQYAKTMWTHIRRSPYQALAAILIMMVTFLTISIFTMLIVGSHIIVNFFSSKPQVAIFFKNEASQQNIDALKGQFEASGKVASVKFVSKDQALSIYKQQNKEDPLMLDLVTADILPASLEVTTYKIEDLADIANSMKTLPIVDKVVYQKDVISTLTSWIKAIRTIGVVLIVILATVSMFIIVTITSIKISQRREEIEIMRLIGATKLYISLPFIYEGFVYGVIGAVVGWAIASGGLLYFSPYLRSFLGTIPLFPIQPLFIVGLLGAEIILAIFLGAFASLLAVYRYLK